MDKRSRLVEAASDLSYSRGFGHVALADIAEAAEVPLGNIYYYFKTKTAIGAAIIAQRRAEFQHMKTLWEREVTPAARLKAYIQMTMDNRQNLSRSGCPMGSLCAELGKERNPLAVDVSGPFEALLAWIRDQFGQMGHAAEKDRLALHLLSAIQGVSLLANSFRDPDLVAQEAESLSAWIDGLEADDEGRVAIGSVR